MARVSTQRGGSATLKLDAQLPLSQASSSVTVQVTSGKAQAKVKAKAPVKAPVNEQGKRRTSTPAKFQEFLMLPPGGSAATGSRKNM
jgi:hypothetical protein